MPVTVKVPSPLSVKVPPLVASVISLSYTSLPNSSNLPFCTKLAPYFILNIFSTSSCSNALSYIANSSILPANSFALSLKFLAPISAFVVVLIVCEVAVLSTKLPSIYSFCVVPS
mgnify:CR=1 FL=1